MFPVSRVSSAAMKTMSFLSLRNLVVLSLLCGLRLPAQQQTPVRNVVLVMTDGMRWQEVFRGADENLLTPENYYNKRDVAPLQQLFLGATPEERRRKLMPFFWEHFGSTGFIFGDQDAGSTASVTNGKNFSYPGYSETLTGHPDPRIDSNDDKPNPNLTVLAWLNHTPKFKGSVAAFGAWHTIANAVNPEKCGCVDNAAYDPLVISPMPPALEVLNAVKRDSPHEWEDETVDAPTFYTAMEYVKAKKPHVLYISLGETDEWAHAGNYGEYLLSAHRADQYMKQLWDLLQSMPEYRDSTALIFTTDHGRGTVGKAWQTHGEKTPESKDIFIAVSAPGLNGKGVQKNAALVTQSQVAATLARFLGEDWKAAEPKAGVPLPLK